MPPSRLLLILLACAALLAAALSCWFTPSAPHNTDNPSALTHAVSGGRHGHLRSQAAAAELPTFQPVALWRALTGQPGEEPPPEHFSPIPQSARQPSPLPSASAVGRRGSVGRARSDRHAG